MRSQLDSWYRQRPVSPSCLKYSKHTGRRAMALVRQPYLALTPRKSSNKGKSLVYTILAILSIRASFHSPFCPSKFKHQIHRQLFNWIWPHILQHQLTQRLVGLDILTRIHSSQSTSWGFPHWYASRRYRRPSQYNPSLLRRSNAVGLSILKATRGAYSYLLIGNMYSLFSVPWRQ